MLIKRMMMMEKSARSHTVTRQLDIAKPPACKSCNKQAFPEVKNSKGVCGVHQEKGNEGSTSCCLSTTRILLCRPAVDLPLGGRHIPRR